MAKEQMIRKASDNNYLHKDFHNFMNLGLDYLKENYGEAAVRQYLQQFAEVFYTPLKEKIKTQGLSALIEHFTDIYRTEEALEDVEFQLSENALMLNIRQCPAVMHMRRCGIEVSPQFYETTRTINDTICEGTPFEFKLIEYDEKTGASIQHFIRRGDAL